MFIVSYRDIDPDTGHIQPAIPLAYCPNTEMADLICSLLETKYMELEADPNRQFIVEHNPDMTTIVI